MGCAVPAEGPPPSSASDDHLPRASGHSHAAQGASSSLPGPPLRLPTLTVMSRLEQRIYRQMN